MAGGPYGEPCAGPSWIEPAVPTTRTPDAIMHIDRQLKSRIKALNNGHSPLHFFHGVLGTAATN